MSIRERIEDANKKALDRIFSAQPVLVDIKPAMKAIPRMKKNIFLHAGPPVSWNRTCGPLRGALTGAAIYEGLASSPKEAISLLESGKIRLSPCHHHQSVGPMTGVLSPSMPVFVVENKTHGNLSFCTLNEGLGKVLRFGAYSEEVIERLRWMEKVLAPILRNAIKRSGGINLKNIIAKALQMGDECHNRNVAATSLFARMIMPYLLRADYPGEELSKVGDFLVGNDHFFLNLSMASCKAMMDTIDGIECCTIVTAMARNGTDFGIRVSGLTGRWFTAPAPKVDGLYFPGFSAKDANPDLGDSTITETRGIGGFAMATAPAIVQFVGGTPTDALNFTRKMREITIARDNVFKIPNLNFEGTPVGIDVRKVVETGIQPAINTGIAHKEPGIGQIGAGVVKAPIVCFKKALEAAAEVMGS